MPRAPTTVEREIAAPEAGDLCVVVVADSHGRPHAHAHEVIAATLPDAILHAGDIGDLAVIDALEAIAPTIAVRGNIDAGDAAPDHVLVRLTRPGKSEVRVLLTHIAVAGPRLRKDARDRAAEHSAGLVICGHSHVPLIAEDRGVWIFNPGSYGPRRFHLPIVFGVLRLGPRGLSLEHIDCETRQKWVPPRAA